MRRLLWAMVAVSAGMLLGAALAAVGAAHAPRALPITLPTVPPLPPLLPGPPDPPAKPAPSQAEFGVNVNGLFNGSRYSAGQITAQLRTLRRTGVTTARTDALWEATEPSPPHNSRHDYDWTFDDQVAGMLAAHGVRWLPILDYTTGWAQSIQGEDHSPPRKPAQFAAYAGAFANRYGTDGTFWRQHRSLPALPVDTYEIWNEPDNSAFWRPSPDPGAYGTLYRLARNAIIAADPPARVIIGGLSKPDSFLPELLQAHPELSGHIDGVGIHPYAPTPVDVLGRVHSARLTLDSLNLGTVPLYVTEFGWNTRPRGRQNWVAGTKRPNYIASTVSALGHTDCGVYATILYTWITQRRDRTDPEQWYGIDPPGRGKSTDVQALKAGLHGALAPASVLPVCSG